MSAAEPVPVAGEAPALDVAARKQAQAWLWETPRRQEIPAVRDTRWPLTPVDAFILHRLETNGLAPARETDDRTWLRRVHFAITGLPPTPGEIHQFLADPGPAGRERVVDRLLASPRFGERWARHWMDLVRYAESRGHESDYHIANAWQYRDYLVRAFNAGVPYNDFLLEHLAGDLLPEPRLRPGSAANESVLATGWAFLGEENHSPVDIRGDECERIDNKVDVFSKTFLGLTVSCARCHDHKFDPITSQDYYALTGFMLGSSYRQVRFEAMENNRRMAAELAALRSRSLPGLAEALVTAERDGIRQVPSYLVAAGELLRGGSLVAASNVVARSRTDGLDAGRLQAWVDHLQTAFSNRSEVLHGVAVLARSGTVVPAAAQGSPAGIDAQGGILPPGTNSRVIADFTVPGRTPWKADGEAFGSGPVRRGTLVPGRDAAGPAVRVAAYGAARRDPFWNRLAAAPGNQDDAGRLGATARAGQMVRTPTFTLAGGRLHYLIRGRTRVYAAVDSHLMLDGPLHHQLTASFNTGASAEPRWVTHDLSAYSGHRTHLEFGPEGAADLEILMVVEAPEPPAWHPLAAPFQPAGEFRSVAAYAGALAQALSAAADWVASSADRPADDDTIQLANWLLEHPGLLESDAAGGAATAAGRRLAEFRRAEAELASRVQWTSRTAAAWFDGTGVDENVLVRGKPFKPGILAPRSLPVAFASARPIGTATSSGRLELGRQLVDPDNPLVARVIVNRVWYHLFGRGIVPTVDNFGALGERPTHPELLDHLAWRFVHEDGWSMKRLIKQLVLTRTFAMGHQAAGARAAELDPANLLWHRMPVRRLEAEAIRDALLAVSGRLNPAVGGPPVPVHLTEFVVGRGRPDVSGPLDGGGRRSLYIAVRRNFLPTAMTTFDFPTPFSTVGRRNVTNVPGQALALMNDPLVHQQARVWAERLLRELPGADEPSRIRWLFESAYGRLPGPEEIQACRETLQELRDIAGPGGDPVLLWADLCHALFNANDFIYVM